jgi:hypothetical protein
MNVAINDDLGGSGVKYFDMYVSENGGAFAKFDSLLTNPVVSFTGTPGKTYCFFSIGTDNVLNAENLKNACELSVTLKDASLPLTWLNFSGLQQQNDVKLTWTTSSEINVSHFILERSLNGNEFEQIARVEARGSAGSTTGYSFVDINAVKMAVPNLYYRLRKLDRDSSVGYSATIQVPLERVFSGLIVNAYPNPFNKEIRTEVISGNPSDIIRNIELINVSGKVVYTRQVNQAVNRTVTLDIPEQLSKGVYILKVRVNDEIRTLKVTRL